MMKLLFQCFKTVKCIIFFQIRYLKGIANIYLIHYSDQLAPLSANKFYGTHRIICAKFFRRFVSIEKRTFKRKTQKYFQMHQKRALRLKCFIKQTSKINSTQPNAYVICAIKIQKQLQETMVKVIDTNSSRDSISQLFFAPNK